MEQAVLHFGENSIIKSLFHKNKKPINVNKVDIKRIALSDKNPSVKIHLNTLWDIDMEVMLFHLHYVHKTTSNKCIC